MHAAEMGGWPPVVGPVLEATKGADYDLKSIPRNVREGTVGKMRRFLDSMARQVGGGALRMERERGRKGPACVRRVSWRHR